VRWRADLWSAYVTGLRLLCFLRAAVPLRLKRTRRPRSSFQKQLPSAAPFRKDHPIKATLNYA
jgi:hypothetical protein